MEGVTLNQKEQKRLMVLNQVGEGRLVGWQAAETLDLSLRHTRRLMAQYRWEGAAALAHGNRGRKPDHALSEELRQRVADLANTVYRGFNTQHFTEVLLEREGIGMSRSTVRRILRSAGVSSPRKRRAPRHRSRRERRAQEGQLLQIDGSRHDWLQGRGPWLTLIGAIDDATGRVPYALFREQEDAQGYFLLMEGIVAREGIPLAVYHDRHSIFEHAENAVESLQEQLEGRRNPTQFGRLMQELGVTSISSYSPQAKGRVERLWGTFQDRLVSELRLAGASNREEANRVLGDLLPRFNDRFGVPPAQDGSAYVTPGADFIASQLFCFKYERTVGVDNVVRFAEHRLQIMPDECRISYARARVQVQERMDGSLAVFSGRRCLATQPAPAEAPVLRTRKNKHFLPLTIEPADAVNQGCPGSHLQIPSDQTNGPCRPVRRHPWRSYMAGFSSR